MKIKFTKASKKDKTLVTVALAQLDGTELDVGRGMTSLGEEVCLVIDGQPTIFTVNRVSLPNSFGTKRALTATTHCFPRFLRLPNVGRPTYADVSGVY